MHQERYEYIRSLLLPFLTSVGFREASLQWLPAVGPAGQNLKAPPTEPLLAWWKGPTLVQAIDKFLPKPRNIGVSLCATCIYPRDVYRYSMFTGCVQDVHRMCVVVQQSS